MYYSGDSVLVQCAEREKSRICLVIGGSMNDLVAVGYSEFAIETFYDVSVFHRIVRCRGIAIGNWKIKKLTSCATVSFCRSSVSWLIIFLHIARLRSMTCSGKMVLRTITLGLCDYLLLVPFSLIHNGCVYC